MWNGKSPRASASLRGNGAIPIAENESGAQLFGNEEHGIAVAESGLFYASERQGVDKAGLMIYDQPQIQTNSFPGSKSRDRSK